MIWFDVRMIKGESVGIYTILFIWKISINPSLWFLDGFKK